MAKSAYDVTLQYIPITFLENTYGMEGEICESRQMQPEMAL